MTHPILGKPLVRAGIALAAVLIFGALLVRGAPESTPMPSSPHSGMSDPGDSPREAPAFSLPDREGVVHSLAELSGRPVLLNFWASWCPPCLDEMPSLQKLANELAGTDLVIVAVTLDENWDDANGALEKTGFGEGALVLADPKRAVAHEYGTEKVPETYLIDREGQIVHLFVGPRDWRDPTLVADIRGFADLGSASAGAAPAGGPAPLD